MSPPNFQDIQKEIEIIYQGVIKESKRVLKKQVPKTPAVREEITRNLLNLYNNFIEILNRNWNNLGEDHKLIIRKYFNAIRDRVLRAYQVLKVRYQIPTSCLKQINPEILYEESESSDSEEDKITENMALSTVEFFNLASKILPNEYDGSFDKQQAFLDALDLLKANSAGNENTAIAYVRTKLIGKARDLIVENDNLESIIEKIRTNIKGESSKLVSSKLLALKQNSKSSVQYASEVEALAANLRRAYISEGVPATVADTYTTNVAVSSLSKNAMSEKAKLIIEAGTFTNYQDALSKFINTNAENDVPAIYQLRGAGSNRNGRNYKNTGNKHYNYNNQRNYVPNNNRGRYNQRRGGRFNSNRGRNYNTNNNQRYIRMYETNANSGNETGSQSGPLEAE